MAIFGERLLSTERHAVQAHEPGGAPLGRAELRWGPDAVVAHPSGAGVVMITADPHVHEVNKLSLVELSDRFEEAGGRVEVAHQRVVGFR